MKFDPIDEILPARRLFILGFQHVLAMYAGAVAVPLVVGSALKLAAREQAYLISADLFTCGLATLLQCVGLTRAVGIRLPVLLGVSFAAVGPMIAIGREYGLSSVYGSILCSGAFVFLIAGRLSRLRRFFPPVVTGSVVTIIGTTLIPVAINWAAGGLGSSSYGSPANLGLAAVVLAVILAVERWATGFLRAVAVLVGLSVGAALAAALGRMDASAVAQAPWFQVTTPFWFGVPRFHLAAVASLCLVGLVCMIESAGVFLAVGKVVGREVSDDDMARGLRAEGLAIAVGGCLNSFPYTTFTQNVGLVALSGVRSRYVTATARAILLVLGLLPKFAALVAALPPAVLGGAGLVMFGIVAASGIRILADVDFKNERNLLIVGVSIALGLGVTVVPQAFARVPESMRWFFSEGIVVGSVAALLLNVLLPSTVVEADQTSRRRR